MLDCLQSKIPNFKILSKVLCFSALQKSTFPILSKKKKKKKKSENIIIHDVCDKNQYKKIISAP